MNKHKHIRLVILLTILFVVAWTTARTVLTYRAGDPVRAAERARQEAIDRVLDARKEKMREKATGTIDPFGADGIVRVLLIGLDKRVGQTTGHCDVIQMIEINKIKEQVTITAVPRGTYSPLPSGVGTTSSDYYVSNSCGLVGIEYGINQIEKIAGMKADYLVIVGFSETLGILRSLRLPTTETLQWLRQRHVYAIGEPQRAHNHSTFIKKMLVDYIPDEPSKIDTALHYIIYKTVKTDLSFDEAEAIARELSRMKISEHPDHVVLAMRPAHSVTDIPYVPEDLEKYLEKTLNPIKNHLSKDDYSGVTTGVIQEELHKMIEAKKKDPEFIIWAFENNLWLQIENDDDRLAFQYECLIKYLTQVKTTAERKTLISDYILEMEHTGESTWSEKGKHLLETEISD